MSGVPIALVEDNESLRTELVFHLNHAGYTATGLADGAALDAHLASQPCRLLVLDLGLPGEDGLSICMRLRRVRPELGVVMLTARGMAGDRLAGLQGGADAYLVKPAPTEELLAVIGNLLRRLRPAVPQPAAPDSAPWLTVSAAVAEPGAVWQLRLRSRVLLAPDGGVVSLTHAEGVLLQALQRSAPGPASRRQLVEALGGNFQDFEERRLEVAISRLRLKLAESGFAGETIRAARGVGYLLTLPCMTQDD